MAKVTDICPACKSSFTNYTVQPLKYCSVACQLANPVIEGDVEEVNNELNLMCHKCTALISYPFYKDCNLLCLNCFCNIPINFYGDMSTEWESLRRGQGNSVGMRDLGDGPLVPSCKECNGVCPLYKKEGSFIPDAYGHRESCSKHGDK